MNSGRSTQRDVTNGEISGWILLINSLLFYTSMRLPWKVQQQKNSAESNTNLQLFQIAKETGNQHLIGLFLSNLKKIEFTFSFRNKNYYLNNKNYPSIAFCQILSFVHKKHIRKYIFKFLDYGHSTTVQCTIYTVTSVWVL